MNGYYCFWARVTFVMFFFPSHDILVCSSKTGNEELSRRKWNHYGAELLHAHKQIVSNCVEIIQQQAFAHWYQLQKIQSNINKTCYVSLLMTNGCTCESLKHVWATIWNWYAGVKMASAVCCRWAKAKHFLYVLSSAVWKQHFLT